MFDHLIAEIVNYLSGNFEIYPIFGTHHLIFIFQLCKRSKIQTAPKEIKIVLQMSWQKKVSDSSQNSAVDTQ